MDLGRDGRTTRASGCRSSNLHPARGAPRAGAFFLARAIDSRWDRCNPNLEQQMDVRIELVGRYLAAPTAMQRDAISAHALASLSAS